ncbi:MAG: hypothetical protein HPY53_06645 [Brevinematales bacterium]|nr:hypothetical protein [Brevinematales bacterium]
MKPFYFGHGDLMIEQEERDKSDNLESWQEFYSEMFGKPCPYKDIATIVEKLDQNKP